MKIHAMIDSCRAGVSGFGFCLAVIITVCATMASVGRADVVLSDDFTGPGLDPGWVASGAGSWAQYDIYADGCVRHTWASATPVPSLSRTFTTPVADAQSWTVDLRYAWFNAASSGSRLRFFMLDANDNGYGLYLQGDTYIELEKMRAGSIVAAGPNLGKTADATATFRQVRLTWDRLTGTLSFYEGNPVGPIGTNLNLLGTFTDITFATFTQLRLDDRSTAGNSLMVDDVRVDIVPRPVVNLLFDDFNTAGYVDPAWVHNGVGSMYQWDFGENGMLRSDGSFNPWPTMTRALSSTATRDWTVDLRYRWFNSHNGGARLRFFMLDDSLNGYGMYVDGDTYAEITKLTADGYAGAQSVTKTDDVDGQEPRQIRLTWEASTGTLSFYEGIPHGAIGANLNLLGSWVDTDYTSFTQFRLEDRSSSTHQVLLDDVRVEMILPPPAGTVVVVR